MPRTRFLVTGGAGFIGHHIVEHLLEHIERGEDWEIVILDAMRHPGNLQRLWDIDIFPRFYAEGRVRFVYHDIRAPIVGNPVLMAQIGPIDFIVHLAAQTHVDDSIVDPHTSVETNVMGTSNLLEFARAQPTLRKMVMFSTDEVLGPAPRGRARGWSEWARMRPSNPYAAGKAGAECLAMAWSRTFGVPLIIARTMNNVGERQDGVKFLPRAIRAVLSGDSLEIHGTKRVIASRCFIHPRNVADAVLFLLLNETKDVIYHIVGEEMTVLDLAYLAADVLGRPLQYHLVPFHLTPRGRLGHDRAYRLADHHLARLGWKPPVPHMESLARAIRWIAAPEHSEWLAVA